MKRYFKFNGYDSAPHHTNTLDKHEDLEVGKVFAVEEDDIDTDYVHPNWTDMRVELEGHTHGVWVDQAYFTEVPKPVANEKRSQGKLWLQVAEFHDRKGNKTTVKRSPCRHYYIKKPGKTQKRATKADVQAVLAQATENL